MVSDYTTISRKRDFVDDVKAYVEDEPLGSVKEFLKHLVLRERESDRQVTESDTREMARKLREPGYVE